MQALLPRAGNRRDTLINYEVAPPVLHRSSTLLREALASDVTWSNMSTGK